MKKFLIALSCFFWLTHISAQYTEPWSDPVAITDSQSFNSDPELLVFETSAYLFYEKKLEINGTTKIYYRDLKNMGPETELLGHPDYDYRNPTLIRDYYVAPEQFLIFESNISGNFEIYVLAFDELMNFEAPDQLTFTDLDESRVAATGTWYNTLAWEYEGDLIAARLEALPDTSQLTNIQVVDTVGCTNPRICNSRLVYEKTDGTDHTIFYSDWDYVAGEWGSPYYVDVAGSTTHCHCPSESWGYVYEAVILYEDEGHILSYYDDDIFELEIPGFTGNMHEPNSVIYSIPVDYAPFPLIITVQSNIEGNDEIYVHWTEDWGLDPENISNDEMKNSHPVFQWGWYASNPCSLYLLDIWETEENGYLPLYMSKCALYVCGGIDEESKPLEVLQVRPNPFSMKTTIRYQAVSGEPVKFEILDSNGTRHFSEERVVSETGWMEFEFIPPAGLSKGILYLRLTEGNRQLFRKVIYK